MKKSIAHLHILCEDWKRELIFYKDEINYLKKRLDEVASKNTNQEIMKEVEHFENKFKIISLHLDELNHDVKLKQETLNNEAAEKPNYINVKMKNENNDILDLMMDTSRDFYQTKKEFYSFLSKVL